MSTKPPPEIVDKRCEAIKELLQDFCKACEEKYGKDFMMKNVSILGGFIMARDNEGRFFDCFSHTATGLIEDHVKTLFKGLREAGEARLVERLLLELIMEDMILSSQASKKAP